MIYTFAVVHFCKCMFQWDTLRRQLTCSAISISPMPWPITAVCWVEKVWIGVGFAEASEHLGKASRRGFWSQGCVFIFETRRMCGCLFIYNIKSCCNSLYSNSKTLRFCTRIFWRSKKTCHHDTTSTVTSVVGFPGSWAKVCSYVGLKISLTQKSKPTKYLEKIPHLQRHFWTWWKAVSRALKKTGWSQTSKQGRWGHLLRFQSFQCIQLLAMLFLLSHRGGLCKISEVPGLCFRWRGLQVRD